MPYKAKVAIFMKTLRQNNYCFLVFRAKKIVSITKFVFLPKTKPKSLSFALK